MNTNEKHIGCPAFMKFIMTATEGNQQTIQRIQASINACLLGRFDLEKVINIAGQAGTGKSTLTRLLIALVGENNHYCTDLKTLETNLFEVSRLRGKRLTTLFNDGYEKSNRILKGLTRGIPFPLERKGYQTASSFIYQGMVAIVSNEKVDDGCFKKLYLTIDFNHKITREERLDYLDNGSEERLLSEIQAITDWALQLTDEEVTEIFEV